MKDSRTADMTVEQTEFGWLNSEATCAHDYLLPGVLSSIEKLYGDRRIRVLDLGCGNGFVASRLSELGHDVTGIDAAVDGINIARTSYSKPRFQRGSIYESEWPGVTDESFDCVVSLEVVEHLLYPKVLFERSYRLIKQEGHLLVSTPYHGYLKNLALSLTNSWDKHFDVAWDGGHIKFFSRKTLKRMALDAGFKNIRTFGAGRLPWLWKSMFMLAEK
jgi:2-polyprenyl-3-methyl-5-hydroxy-6-metoxy-1,4-benzoquinol methylase